MEPWKRKEVIGNATLYLGDCLEILPTLPKVDAVITDPPYGIGFRYYSQHDDTDLLGYRRLIEALKPYPLALLQYPEEMMRLIVPVLGAPDECLTWVYPSNLPRQCRIWGFWGLPVKWGRVKQPAKNPECKKVKNLFVDSYDWVEVNQVKNTGSEKTAHPCQVPVELMERVIRLTDPMSCVDPCMGSGSTGVACGILGKPFIGVESDPAYFDIACERIENAQRQQRMFA